MPLLSRLSTGIFLLAVLFASIYGVEPAIPVLPPPTITTRTATDSTDPPPGSQFHEITVNGVNIEIEETPHLLEPARMQNSSVRQMRSPDGSGIWLRILGYVGLGAGTALCGYGAVSDPAYIPIGGVVLGSAIFCQVTGYIMKVRHTRWEKRHGKD